MLEVIFIFILVILLAFLILRFSRDKFIGGNEPTISDKSITRNDAIITKPTTMLFNGMGIFHYWLVQERLARVGFVNLEHPDVIDGVLVGHVDNLPPVDYLRLDVSRYDAASSINYDLLRVRTRVINKFERESRRGLVVKHLFHEKMRNRPLYPHAIDYADLADNLDRVWILRPSTARVVPGVPIFYKFNDVFIVHDAASLERAQARYAELGKIAGDELHISVTEYLKPALIQGRKFTLTLYMLVAKDRTGVRSVCSINLAAAYIYLANSPYEHDNFTEKSIHYPMYERRYTRVIPAADFPADIKKSIDAAAQDIEKELCEIGRELICPANSDSAYEIFSVKLIIDEANRAYIVEVSPRTVYHIRMIDTRTVDNMRSDDDVNVVDSTGVQSKHQEALADWETKTVLELMQNK